MRLRTILFSLLVVSLALFTGCWEDSSVPPPGFGVQTFELRSLQGGQGIGSVPRPETQVAGYWRWDFSGGTVGQTLFFNRKTDAQGKSWIDNGRAPAYWDFQYLCGTLLLQDYLRLVGYQRATIDLLCPLVPLGSSTNFEITGQTPSTIVLGGNNLTSASGMPLLYTYDRSGRILNTAYATQVSGDGTQATFPFPRQSTGADLNGDIYGMSIVNSDTASQTYCEPMYDEWGNYIGDYCWDVPGERRFAGAHFIGIGTKTDLPGAPFGVDASATEVFGSDCYYQPPEGEYGEGGGSWNCFNWSSYYVEPIVTLYAAGQINFRGALLNVGANPTAIRSYWNEWQTTSWGDSWYTYTEETVRPSRALVVNTGSNSVTVVDLLAWQVITNISVGSHPTSLLIRPDQSKAYVSNYNSYTVSEIDLATNTVSRTVTVGYHPNALAMDPSGSAFWVGGQGWMSKIDAASLAVVATQSVNGTITSMAASNGQNTLIYTAMTNASAPDSTYAQAISYPSSNYSVREVRLSDFSTIAERGAGSASSYQYYSVWSPSPSQLAGGTQVSVNYGNGISISATPGGFLVLDATGGQEIMRGTTPTPVRGIAGDIRESVAFITVPDSNMLLIVPLPRM